MKILKFIWSLPSTISILFIRFYQKTLSPDHGLMNVFFRGGYCRFTPTCSSYTIGAIQKYGFFKGWIKGIWRIIRCNPWSCGGIDLP